MSTELEPETVCERRGKSRLQKPFHIVVRGVGSKGRSFEVVTVLKNISSSGIYFMLDQTLEVGTELSFNIRLSTSEIDEVRVAKVAAKGTVVRAEPQPDGRCGLAVTISKYRLIQ
jgi:hypothetical protein